MQVAVRCVLACLLLVPPVADTAELLGSSVTRSGNFYRAAISIRIDAPLAVVYAAITDYAHLADINPDIVESRVLASPTPDRDRVYSAAQICILIFCKRMVHVQDVERQDKSAILAVTQPAQSDFRSGVARWRLSDEGTSTLMRFNQEFEPDFWVPPVIGPWLVERKLVEEVTESARRIEGLVQRPAVQ